MPQCISTIALPVEAQTSTGPDATQAECLIGDRLDIKHFVWMKNLRNFPVDITSFSEIRAEPRLIRFELADRTVGNLSEDEWSAMCLLDTDEESMFHVSLLSTGNDNTEQSIEVVLVIDRLHGGPSDKITFEPLTVFS